MPVILNPDSYDLWLDPGHEGSDRAVSELLRPWPPSFQRTWGSRLAPSQSALSPHLRNVLNVVSATQWMQN